MTYILTALLVIVVLFGIVLFLPSKPKEKKKGWKGLYDVHIDNAQVSIAEGESVEVSSTQDGLHVKLPRKPLTLEKQEPDPVAPAPPAPSPQMPKERVEEPAGNGGMNNENDNPSNESPYPDEERPHGEVINTKIIEELMNLSKLVQEERAFIMKLVVEKGFLTEKEASALQAANPPQKSEPNPTSEEKSNQTDESQSNKDDSGWDQSM